ncbi:MAG: hypothetical protein CMH52_01145 [Myxococcales bacterium]|nr:hypothetical protein [Myxococcales bacterium]|tara:strand:- start:582 stop:1805 length:1224 start_codon:yes stop_codon:yes gene_type:complete
MNIEFYYDIVCPYAYLASTQIEALAERNGATVSWKPVLLGGIFRSIGGQQVPMSTMSQPRARLNLLDLERWADLWNVPFSFADGHPRRSVDAMRLLTALSGQDRIDMSQRLFRAYWIEGLDISDRAVLDKLALEMGYQAGLFATETARNGLFECTAEAVQHGAFGVPAFVIDGRLWWGQDRLHFVEAALGGVPSLSETNHTKGDRIVRFYHDFSSPFSYLAATQIEQVVAGHGATLQWRPILLGALFREIGTPDVPLFEMSEPKRRYMSTDLGDWAQFWGVDFSFPSSFPIRTVQPLRAALVEPSLTGAIYRAAWAEGRVIDDPAVLADIIAEAGFDAESVLAKTTDATVKAALRDNTEEARQIGACGVPTFHLIHPKAEHDPLLLWGQDRIHMLERALLGWHPDCG